MSTELYAKGPLALTRFYGGDARGMCLQLTARTGSNSGSFVSVPMNHIPMLIHDLQSVLDGTIGEEP